MRKKIKCKIIWFSILLILIMGNFNELKSQIKIGIFADCQYCNCETAGKRFYRNSLAKLDETIHEFNNIKNIGFVVGLGDLIDRDITSFDSVNLVLGNSAHPVFHVLGNHDYEVEKTDFSKVAEKLGLKNTYYSFEKEGWKFIFLNGNEITFQTSDPQILRQAEEMTAKLIQEDKPNSAKWNGGISETQMMWLTSELQKAELKQLKVIIFCHYPLLPLEVHTLWNADQVLSLLEKHTCVKAWINGHNHNGNYVLKNGIHFINLKGMVDTEKENAFSIINLSADKIEIKGFGREENRSLTLRVPDVEKD